VPRHVPTTGIQSQGIQSQGIQSQGIQSQGIQSQGIQSQGIQSQGIQSQGIQSQGIQSQGIQSQEIHSKEISLSDIHSTRGLSSGIHPLIKNSLSSIINHYKGDVKKWCNRNGFPHFKWQSRFNDRIIRNDLEFFRIQQYIKDNPQNWKRR
jgi:hypothetical protein